MKLLHLCFNKSLQQKSSVNYFPFPYLLTALLVQKINKKSSEMKNTPKSKPFNWAL